MKTICIVGAGPSGLACVKDIRWSLGDKIEHFNIDSPHSESSDFPWNKEDYVGVVDGVEEDFAGVMLQAFASERE
jgi:hypothetical protein